MTKTAIAKAMLMLASVATQSWPTGFGPKVSSLTKTVRLCRCVSRSQKCTGAAKQHMHEMALQLHPLGEVDTHGAGLHRDVALTVQTAGITRQGGMSGMEIQGMKLRPLHRLLRGHDNSRWMEPRAQAHAQQPSP